jgi:hypothetical protein
MQFLILACGLLLFPSPGEKESLAHDPACQLQTFTIPRRHGTGPYGYCVEIVVGSQVGRSIAGPKHSEFVNALPSCVASCYGDSAGSVVLSF